MTKNPSIIKIKICRHNTDNINNDTRIGTRHVILAKHWMWLPDDGFMWTETCWSSFYNFNYFNNLRILLFVCISWTIKCFNFNVEIKLCIKTKLVTKTCKRRDPPSAHDLYSSWQVSSNKLKMFPQRVQKCSWLTYYFYNDLFLTVINRLLFINVFLSC